MKSRMSYTVQKRKRKVRKSFILFKALRTLRLNHKKQKTRILLFGFWWYLQGSNQGHMDFQSIALPSELRYRLVLNAGAKIESFSVYPKHLLKKINSYLRRNKK